MGHRGRRVRVVIGVAATLGLLSAAVGPLQRIGAATGSDPDAEISVSDGSPLAGGTIEVALANLEPNSPVSVQLCVGTAATSPPGQPVAEPTSYDAEACRPVGDLSTDSSGSASGQVTLPADGYQLGGWCSYEAVPGAGSFSFGGTVTGDCTLAVIGDTSSERLTPLATTPLAVRLGDGSVTAALLDNATGNRLTDIYSFDGNFCPVGDVAGCLGLWYWARSPLLSFSLDGEVTLNGLPDDDYLVFGSYYGQSNRASDLRVVTVAEGAAVRADLHIPHADDTSFSSTGSGIDLSVSPDVDVPFDAPLQVTASGFDPGDDVRVAFCPRQPLFTVSGGELQLTCGQPEVVAAGVADESGNVDATVPFDRSRFTRGCSDYYHRDEGAASFSFNVDPRCFLVAFETTGSPSFAWTEVDFLAPAGVATVGGTVTADGVAVEDATVSLHGNVGIFSRRTGSVGDYAFGGQPDGEVTLTAVLPNNFHFVSDEEQGPDSFSFGIGGRHLVRTATVTGQQDLSVDIDFDIEPGGVRGAVRHADGTAAPGAYVQLSGDGVSLSETTGESGAYSFHGLPDGTYELIALGWDDSGTNFTRSEIVVIGGVVEHDLRFPVTNSSISGRVTGSDGEPFPGASVSACPVEEYAWWWFGSCRSAEVRADGSFSIGRLAAGTWEVSASSPLSSLSYVTETVVLGEDEDVTGVDLVLERASGSVAGSVLDDGGEPVVGAWVYVCTSLLGIDWIGACASSVTDGSGDYVVAGVPDGAYSVSAYADGFAGSTTMTAVESGGPTTGVDLILRAPRVVPPGTTVGGVSGDSGIPSTGWVLPDQPTPVAVTGQCPGASVSFALTGEDGSVWAGGTLEESSVVPGSYSGDIPPQAGRSGRAELAITVNCPDGEPDPLPILIDIYIDPSGNVVDLDGTPVDGATVTLSRSDFDTGPFTPVPDGSAIMSPENRTNPDLTDETGYFGWLTVPGFYKVRAEKDGCRAPGAPEQAYVETPPLPVPPEQVGLELVLDCSTGSGEDETAPTVRLDVDPEPNANGWNSTAVTATVVASDDGSGVASTTLVVDGVETGEAEQVFTEGEADVAGRATDNAGNVATTPSTAVRVDTEDPTVSITAPLDGAIVSVGDVVPVSYSCSDVGSGIDTCVGGVADGAVLDTSVPGPVELNVTATDRAGRTATGTVTVTVEGVGAVTDEISLAFSGSVRGTWTGPVSGGDLRVTRNRDGVVESVRGTVEVPGANGGAATATVQLNRVWILDVYVGEIRLVDTGAKVRQTTPVLLERLRQAPDGTVSGVTGWFTGLFSPYRLAWSVRDGSSAPT